MSPARPHPSVPLPALITQAGQRLKMTQTELATLVESSHRTVQRWIGGSSTPFPRHLHLLADAVRPHDAELADHIDAWAPRPAPPPPPDPPRAVEPPPAPPLPPPPAPPPVPVSVFVNAIVCATADATGMKPSDLRPLLLAAFTEAARTRISAAEIAEGLEESLTKKTEAG